MFKQDYTTKLLDLKKVNYKPKELPEVLSLYEFKGNSGGEKYICFPQAMLVADKFHVVRQASWAMDRVRKTNRNCCQ